MGLWGRVRLGGRVKTRPYGGDASAGTSARRAVRRGRRTLRGTGSGAGAAGGSRPAPTRGDTGCACDGRTQFAPTDAGCVCSGIIPYMWEYFQRQYEQTRGNLEKKYSHATKRHYPVEYFQIQRKALSIYTVLPLRIITGKLSYPASLLPAFTVTPLSSTT